MQTKLKKELTLIELRQKYYDKLVNDLKLLDLKKKVLIKNYTTVIKEIDEKIKNGVDTNGKKETNNRK